MTAARALVALGSNLGDRAGHLLGAVAALSRLQGFELSALSPIYETEPVGPADQPPYLNAVLVGRSALEPEALLAALLEIERAHGRVRRECWGPRTLDLDLLDFGGRVLERPGLSLPHPRLHERAFVLVPLAEVAPDWRHPLRGATAAELLAKLDRSGVRPWEPAY
ncbi:2-amino-4-hydroxy-6-hydroxymethyldihydropteridine diphosphokinase [Oceanithermus desulfurans]|uniref:2-amino-4-hydroxy-6-hydroxymethyldihydropteridine diphosphokinase n=2 Tax=Oceanithermus desulfurans TaxID=227924 RepID=A0A511RG11_9DEIN|nr:2-amino-4-hydroxy-6-hydroxymethyldihydropteridine diphosphokinase [Oceanithermus desulfurans]MBB6030911.1 2-amino-4-hydroxy-6-hydroxymethyldihydropteridine diphosphokinase [Oceanithermus desulfurans]GEM88583.1 2-amino-4-hydroxy-6-hydroxymethyldihydropteridine diphosphokinase [Oceanithermus desulfurans NBRC 100063]